MRAEKHQRAGGVHPLRADDIALAVNPSGWTCAGGVPQGRYHSACP